MNVPETAKKKKSGGRTVLSYLANVHPRLPFCRDAALFKLTGGQERLVCRDYGKTKKEAYDLYLDDKPLADIFINSCCEFSCHFRGGYGDGLAHEESCQAVRDQNAQPFDKIKQAEKLLEPYVGLMESGLYVVADFEMFPVHRDDGCVHFWDKPEYCDELHFIHCYVGGGTLELDTPLFLAPTRRAADINVNQVQYYRSRLDEGDAFPRAIALYLNGGVALLLDGHHKAAACAMEGRRVRTLVIFPMENTDNRAMENAAARGTRLYLQRSGRGVCPVAVCDGQENVLGWLSCLEHMKKTRVYAEPLGAPEWGRVPDELCTERFKDYPSVSMLANGCRMNPQDVRRLIEGQKTCPRGQYDMNDIYALKSYVQLFPDTKWLSASEIAWLNRPDDKFEDYGYEVERVKQ